MSRAELEHIAARYRLSPSALTALNELFDRLVGNASMHTLGQTNPGTSLDDTRTDEVPQLSTAGAPDRYTHVGRFGRGAMGEVLRVHDRDLDRVVAMKVLSPSLVGRAGYAERFAREARLVAGLAHPSIVPVHELGALPDGRPYFTMRPVEGRTLSSVLVAVHGGGRRPGDWDRPRAGFTLHRLVSVLHQVCEAVAFAHDRGWVHRDLKPAHVVLGQHGEVQLLDWGLARRIGEAGNKAGTPGFMAPEQERGEPVGPTADVFSLGAVLAEILGGKTRVGADEVGLPADLIELSSRCVAPDVQQRPPHAGAVGLELLAWLEGAKDRDKAQALLEEAEALRPDIARLRAAAVGKREEARALAATIPSWAPVADKAGLWHLEDEARRLDAEAESSIVGAVQLLRGALSHAPRLARAHRGLADYFRWRHERAEAERDTLEAARTASFLRQHDDGAHADWLAGDGQLSLLTDPPGAEVELFRFTERERRLVPSRVGVLGTTPLRAVPLAMGSYLLVLRAAGRAEVRYPVRILRKEHWDGVPPGATEPEPVVLPPEGALSPDEVYVPAGWFTTGGDAAAFGALPRRRVWVDGFAMARFPVTVGQLVGFLNGLLASGRGEEASRLAPRERPVHADEVGELHLELRDGRFVLGAPEASAAADQPATWVTWFAADAYARHLAEVEGRAWRLPGELEWEKAARGVDERIFPWGDTLDPTWTNIRDSQPGGALLAPTDSFPVDESVYGARGLGGNVQDWCLDAWQADGATVVAGRAVRAQGDREYLGPRVYKGGFWSGTAHFARAAMRPWNAPTNRYASLGFRLVRSL